MRSCCRKDCRNVVEGNAQVCASCKADDKLCRKCRNPHGGPPATTKFCKECRRDVRRKPRSPRNPPWSAEDDQKIREAYATYNARQVGAALRRLFPTRPRWSITRRAQVLGAATIRTKEPPWSQAEDDLLADLAWMSPERIATKFRERGFKRTLTAIGIRLKRRELRRTLGGMTAQSLANQLGVDVHKVLGWIKSKLLAAERRGTTGDNHDAWYITTEAIRAFLLAHPEDVELTKLERVGSKMWFLDMITGGRIPEGGEAAPALAQAMPQAADRTVALAGERVTISTLAEISGRPVAALLHRIDGLGMSVEQAAFGDDEAAPAGEPTVEGRAVAAQLLALMRRHRAKPRDLVAWTGTPLPIVERILAGVLPLLPGPLASAVQKLDGEIAITITPKKRSYEV